MAGDLTDATSSAVVQPDVEFDFTIASVQPSKRSLEDTDLDASVPEGKRPKSQPDAHTVEADFEEDALTLLLRNALSNAGDLTDHAPSGNIGGQVQPLNPMDLPPLSGRQESTAPRPTFIDAPLRYVREASLCALGNLSLSVLLVIVQTPLGDAMKLLKASESEPQRTFAQLKASFESVRRLYSSDSALSAEQLEVEDDESRSLIDLANMAQLGLLLVDGSPKALSEADERFLAFFQCQFDDLPLHMDELYLALGTRGAIEPLSVSDEISASKEAASDVNGKSLSAGPKNMPQPQPHGVESISADESPYTRDQQTAKEMPQGRAEEQAEPAADCPREKDPMETILPIFVRFVRGKVLSQPELGAKVGIEIRLDDNVVSEHEPQLQHEPYGLMTGQGDLDLDDMSRLFEQAASGIVEDALAELKHEDAAVPSMDEIPASSAQKAPVEVKSETTSQDSNSGGRQSYEQLIAAVAESTSNYVRTTLNGMSPIKFQPTILTSAAAESISQTPCVALPQAPAGRSPYGMPIQPQPEPQQTTAAPGEPLPPNQTCPSSMLYDRARQAFLSKQSSQQRKEGASSARRPWTSDEELALMTGLDMVKGPHWSQILTIFGKNGAMSDILGERTQVQLKDKARNLKLLFLKTGMEMPYYLKLVTGELKTRAPSQAARKEAEEKAKLTTEKEQAKLQGIMALTSSLQHPPNGPGSVAATHAAVKTAQSAPSATTAAVVAAGTTSTAAGAVATGPSPAQQGAGQHGNPTTQAAQPSRSRPAPTPASKMRPGAQKTTQHLLHAVAQGQQRPQAQLPPQVPRPQGPPRQQPQQQQQQQQRPSQQTPSQGQQTEPQTQQQQQQQQQQQPPTNGHVRLSPALAELPNASPAPQPLAPTPTAGTPSSTTSSGQPAATSSQMKEPPIKPPLQPNVPASTSSASPVPAALHGRSQIATQQAHQQPQPPQNPSQAPERGETRNGQQNTAADGSFMEGRPTVVAQGVAS